MAIWNKLQLAAEAKLDEIIQKANTDAKPQNTPWDRKGMVELNYQEEMQYGWKERRGLVGPGVLKNMARKDSMVAAIIQTRLSQVSAFAHLQEDKYSPGFKVVPKEPADLSDDDKLRLADPSLEEEEYNDLKYKLEKKRTKAQARQKQEIKEIITFLTHCGSPPQETDTTHKRFDFNKFLRLIANDRLIYNYSAIELIPNKTLDRVIRFYPVSAGTIRYVSQQSAEKYLKILKEEIQRRQKLAAIEGKPLNFAPPQKPFKYVQVVRGRVVAAWTEDELVFEPGNPTVDPEDNSYAPGELELLIQIVTSHLYAEAHNRNFFTQGIGTKGILHIKGDNISRGQLEGFKRQWFCISPDSLIFTKQGTIPVIDLVKDEFDVWTGTNFQRAKAFRTNVMEEKITILENGMKLKTSENHKLPVLSPEGTISFIEQKDLERGDYLLLNSEELDINNKHYQILEINNELSNRKGLNPDKIEIDEKMAEVLGWLIGDGTLHWSEPSRNYSIQLFYAPGYEEFLADKHFEILNKKGLNAYRKDLKADPNLTKCGYKPTILINSKPIVKALLDAGFMNSKDGKTIPNCVMMWPRSCQISFLKGLISSDGGLCKTNLATTGSKAHQIVFTSVHESLRNNLLIMLNSLGISSKVSKDKAYKIYIQDKEAFFDKIGFLNPHKQEFEINKNQNKKWDLIPQALAKKLAFECKNSDKYELLSRNDKLDICAVLRDDRRLSRKKATQLFGQRDELKYRYSAVKEIIHTGKELQMYDIEVFDDSHVFCCNGIIVHNSQLANTRNAFRPPIIGMADEVKWVELAQSNKDMEFDNWMHYLIRIACAIYQIDPAEINFDISKVATSTLNETNNEQKLKMSRDKGLRPLLDYIESIINKQILPFWDKELASKYEFRFVGLQAETKMQEIERLEKEAEVYKTVNEIRIEMGKAPIEDGDVLLNANFTQYKQAKLAEAQMPEGAPGEGEGQPQEEDQGVGGELDDLGQELDGIVSDVTKEVEAEDKKKAEKEKADKPETKEVKKSREAPLIVEYYTKEDDE